MIRMPKYNKEQQAAIDKILADVSERWPGEEIYTVASQDIAEESIDDINDDNSGPVTDDMLAALRGKFSR